MKTPYFRSLQSLAVFAFFTLFLSVSSFASSFLWTIEGDKTSYLFGTIHSPDPKATTLAPQVASALQASDSLFTELRMDPATMQGALVLMMRQDGSALLEILGEDLYNELDNTLKGITPGMSVAMLEPLKVWALTLTLELLEHQIKYADQPALDQKLWLIAQEKGLELNGLEKVEEQLEAFESLSTDEQVGLLREALELHASAKRDGSSSIDELVEIYLTGDLEAIGEKVREQMDLSNPINRKLFQKLFTERNIRMADRIYEQLTKSPNKSFFFAVGAGHYWGKDNIIELLEKKGLKVHRVAAPKSPELLQTH